MTEFSSGCFHDISEGRDVLINWEQREGRDARSLRRGEKCGMQSPEVDQESKLPRLVEVVKVGFQQGQGPM